MPVQPPLTETERVVLDVLMAPGRNPRNSTFEAIMERGALERRVVDRALWSLQQRKPPLAYADVDEGIDVRFYGPMPAAAEAMSEFDD